MSFNIFATATSDIPLANLDANFTMIGSSAVASTLYPTATTSITYGTAGTIHYFSGSGLAVTGTLSATLDATIYGVTVGRGGGALSTNTAVGASALAATNTSTYQVAVGYQALQINTSGGQNTAVGGQTLTLNTTSASNVAVGFQALQLNTAADNTAVGTYALNINTSGASNVAVGKQALGSNTTASNNTAVGYQAGYSNTTGSVLTALGYKAGYSNTTGTDSVFLGSYAGYSSSTVTNTFAGASCGYYVTGTGNSAFGYCALGYATAGATGNSNTAIGHQTLLSNTTASNNTAVGYQAGYTNTTGTNNVAFGKDALRLNNTTSNNTAVGTGAGKANTGSENTFIGSDAGETTTTGTFNTFLGRLSGSSVTSGGKNTIIGSYTGSAAPISATGSNYIVLSDGDGNVRGTFDSSGNLLVGKTTTVLSSKILSSFNGATQNGVVIDDPNSTANAGFVAMSINNGTYCGSISRVGSTSAVVYTATSDRRLKENIVDAPSALAHINSVKVRSFNWIDGGHQITYGVIAQEFFDVEPDAVIQGDSGETIEKTWSVDTSALVPAMIKAIQEQQAIITALTTRITALEAK